MGQECCHEQKKDNMEVGNKPFKSPAVAHEAGDFTREYGGAFKGFNELSSPKTDFDKIGSKASSSKKYEGGSISTGGMWTLEEEHQDSKTTAGINTTTKSNEKGGSNIHEYSRFGNFNLAMFSTNTKGKLMKEFFDTVNELRTNPKKYIVLFEKEFVEKHEKDAQGNYFHKTTKMQATKQDIQSWKETIDFLKVVKPCTKFELEEALCAGSHHQALYSCRRGRIGHDNIAQEYGSPPSFENCGMTPSDKPLDWVFQYLIDSFFTGQNKKPHRDAMFNPALTKAGVAAVYDGEFWYTVLNMASKSYSALPGKVTIANKDACGLL